MGRHDHHLHEGESLHDAARNRLTERGEQWTDMRAAVFKALAGFDRPASAYDIAEAVSKAEGRRVVERFALVQMMIMSAHEDEIGAIGRLNKRCRVALGRYDQAGT